MTAVAFLATIPDRYARYGWSAPEGEWGVIQSIHRAALHEALDDGYLDDVLADFFRTYLKTGLVSYDVDATAPLDQQTMWRLALWTKMTDDPDMRRLAAVPCGNPPVASIGTPDGPVLIMPDTTRFDIYAGRIIRGVGKGATVVEIGGGYGGTALQLLRRDPTARVILCDIPETLYLAGYWLASSGEVSVAWWDEHRDAQVQLLPAQDLDRFYERPDLVFSSHTFSGLDPENIVRYLAWLETSGARAFYQDDVLARVKGPWLTEVFDETIIESMRPPSMFQELWREHTPWTGVGDRFCEVWWERVA